MRVVPFVWLVGAFVGLSLAFSTLGQVFRGQREPFAIAVVIIAILVALPNIALAARLTFGALVGD